MFHELNASARLIFGFVINLIHEMSKFIFSTGAKLNFAIIPSDCVVKCKYHPVQGAFAIWKLKKVLPEVSTWAKIASSLVVPDGISLKLAVAIFK